MLSNGKERKLIYFWSVLKKRFWTLPVRPQQRKEPMDTSSAPAPQRGLCAGAGSGHRLSVPVSGLSGMSQGNDGLGGVDEARQDFF